MNFNEWFYYDETSLTCLRWRVDIVSGRNGNQVNVRAGEVAGCATGKRKHHFVVTLGSKQHLIHRVVYALFNPMENPTRVDHKDGDGYNNKIGNLRAVTHAVNMRNCKKRVDNKTGVAGVTRRLNRHGNVQFSAQWKTLDGVQRSKTFGVSGRTEEEAFKLACNHREEQIAELNLLGANYSERHGT